MENANRQFSELLISSRDTLGDRGAALLQPFFASGPQCSGATGGEGHLSARGDLFVNEISLLY